MIELVGFIAVAYTSILGWLITQRNSIEIPVNVRYELYHRLL